MAVHELKTDPEMYQAVAEGKKAFDIRKADRSFAVGDILLFRETKYTGIQMSWDDIRGSGKPLVYTGRKMEVKVTYTLHGPIYGIQSGYCIMSIGHCA